MKFQWHPNNEGFWIARQETKYGQFVVKQTKNILEVILNSQCAVSLLAGKEANLVIVHFNVR